MRGDIFFDADILEQSAGDLAHGVLIHPTDEGGAFQRFAAEEEIARDGQFGYESGVLVYRLDAVFDGVGSVVDRDLLAVYCNGATASRYRAREDLDQGRLASAVVAEQANDLAFADG